MSNLAIDPIDRIFELFETRGAAQYRSERVTQLQHALQCAALAEADGANAALIVAALLHDIGHLVHDLGEDAAADGIDNGHELRGREWLARWFGEPVTEPVRLHVNAKRYLTATEPGYFGALSFASRRSLALQGGPRSAPASPPASSHCRSRPTRCGCGAGTKRPRNAASRRRT